MVELLETRSGPCLLANGEKFFLPRDSADLHTYSQYSQIFGHGHFFITGFAEPPAADGKAFSTSDDVNFKLGKKIACNPRRLDDPTITKAQRAFAEYRAADPEFAARFPTIEDVRLQRGDGAGVQLVSGGGCLFVDYDAGEGPEVRIALFRSSDGAGWLGGAESLVEDDLTASRAMVESYSVVCLRNGVPTVLAFTPPMPTGMTLRDEVDWWGHKADWLSLKRAQETVILDNLGTKGLHFHRSPVEPVLKQSQATLNDLYIDQKLIYLFDPTNRSGPSETLAGFIGFDHSTHTWIYRSAGTIVIPSGVDLFLVDGETQNRRIQLVTRSEAEQFVFSRSMDPTTSAFLERQLLDLWPGPQPRPSMRPSSDKANTPPSPG